MSDPFSTMSDEKTCPRCEKTLYDVHGLKRHLQRKVPCAPKGGGPSEQKDLVSLDDRPLPLEAEALPPEIRPNFEESCRLYEEFDPKTANMAVLRQKYGRRLVLIARSGGGLVARWAPLRLVEIGDACRRSLRLVEKDDLVPFVDSHISELLDDVQLVCAPPITGNQAFMLAETLSREDFAVSYAADQLEAISSVCGYTPSAAKLLTCDAERRMRGDTRNFTDEDHVVDPPKGEWAVYGWDPETGTYRSSSSDGELSERLASTIRAFATSICHVHPRLPKDYDLVLMRDVQRILQIADEHDDGDLFGTWAQVAFAHPSLGPWLLRDPHLRRNVFGGKIVAGRIFPDEIKTALDFLCKEEVSSVANDDPVVVTKPNLRPVYLFEHSREQEGVVWMKKPDFHYRDLAAALVHPDEAIRRLNRFAGFDVDELDLSKSFITGSALCYALAKTNDEKQTQRLISDSSSGAGSGCFRHHAGSEDKIFLMNNYPAAYTVPESSELYSGVWRIAFDADKVPHYSKFNISATVRPGKTVDIPEIRDGGKLPLVEARIAVQRRNDMPPDVFPFGPPDDPSIGHDGVWRATLSFGLKTGSDVDIAVDSYRLGRGALSADDEFDEIAQKHFRVVRRHFPHTKIRRVDRQNGHIWEIYTDDLQALLEGRFREIQIYRGSLGKICTHHLSMVRALYTHSDDLTQNPAHVGLNDLYGAGAFYYTATFLAGMIAGRSYNYYCFRSAKALPQEIIAKYDRRGFGIPQNFPKQLKSALGYYIYRRCVGSDGEYNDIGPLASGRGPFNVLQWRAADLHLGSRAISYRNDPSLSVVEPPPEEASETVDVHSDEYIDNPHMI